MRRREFIALVGGGVAASTRARPEQPNRVWRVGMLHVVPDQASLGFTAFRKQLAEFGYVEGQNIVFEYRWSDQARQLPTLAAELRRWAPWRRLWRSLYARCAYGR
jgi:putative tryptophan/tyrosine transport system substrate-binding protein